MCLLLTRGGTRRASRNGSFKTVDLSPSANGRIHARLRSLGLKSWLPAGDVTVCGIPFKLLGEGENIVTTPPDIDTVAGVEVGEQGSEVYLLLVAS